MFKEIREKIIEVINQDADKIGIAYKTDRSSMEAFPCAIVSPSENQSDYGSTAQRDRMTFIFRVRIYYPIKDEANQEAAELALEDALDQMIDIFRNRTVLDGVADWVQPIPSVWQYELRNDGTYRMAEITLNCVKYIGG